ncbi:hypothetical protein LCGC14_1094820 [marine sediment metagenome]|uniref:Uncharacterized protein n=1 Tax=marine sediment metagenome TaxID=412755 RepID=A0A0F9MFN3_9ZZZZ
MSWSVYLEDRTQKPDCNYGIPPEEFKPAYEGDEPCNIPCYPTVGVARHSEGGTYAVGGIENAELNITYNYGREFGGAIGYQDGFVQWLTDKKAKDVVSLLRVAVKKLGTERSDNYWASTPGNAGHALSILLGWAEQYPEAIFRVS